jgi:hypothetical protein
MNEQTLGSRVGNALSAAGITLAPIIDRPIEVFSSDPLDGHEVRVPLTPEGSASWEPDGAVVLAGCGCDGPAFTRVLPGNELLQLASKCRAVLVRTERRQRLPDLDARGHRVWARDLRRPPCRRVMPTPVDRQEVQRLLVQAHAQLVEVLPPAEFEDERLPGAVNIPLKQLDRETSQQLEPRRPVIVYCYDCQ